MSNDGHYERCVILLVLKRGHAQLRLLFLSLKYLALQYSDYGARNALWQDHCEYQEHISVVTIRVHRLANDPSHSNNRAYREHEAHNYERSKLSGLEIEPQVLYQKGSDDHQNNRNQNGGERNQKDTRLVNGICLYVVARSLKEKCCQ
ncbi:Hypothetical_protein [Hexamita inflata]|uniref:Hypothetical_protein n=1 Tax=Hexamita inflata TaxID=28002 RepID=A0ABP1HCM7_9EUKA